MGFSFYWIHNNPDDFRFKHWHYYFCLLAVLLGKDEEMTDYKSDKRNLLQTFVQACVIEERQQRVAFEFSNPKKYVVAISRFAHDTESLCKTKALVSITDSEHIPTEYINGTLLVFDLYQKGITSAPTEARKMMSDSYGPIIILSTQGRAMIKAEDNKIFLFKF